MNKSLFITSKEQELIDQLKDKNELSFNYLYDKYSAAVYTIILQIIPDRQLACDILQNVFVNIWVKIDSYDCARGRLFTWMLHIARNLSIDILQSKSYQNSKKNLPVENMVHVELKYKATELNIESIGLKKVILKLKPEHQKMINLVYFNGYTCGEIATINKTPLGTVKTRLRSALSHLRQSFV